MNKDRMVLASGSVDYNGLNYSYVVSKTGEDITIQVSSTIGGKNDKESNEKFALFVFSKSKEEENKYILNEKKYKMDFAVNYDKDNEKLSFGVEKMPVIGNIFISKYRDKILIEKNSKEFIDLTNTNAVNFNNNSNININLNNLKRLLSNEHVKNNLAYKIETTFNNILNIINKGSHEL